MSGLGWPRSRRGAHAQNPAQAQAPTKSPTQAPASGPADPPPVRAQDPAPSKDDRGASVTDRDDDSPTVLPSEQRSGPEAQAAPVVARAAVDAAVDAAVAADPRPATAPGDVPAAPRSVLGPDGDGSRAMTLGPHGAEVQPAVAAAGGPVELSEPVARMR